MRTNLLIAMLIICVSAILYCWLRPELPGNLDGLEFSNSGDDGFRHDFLSFARGEFRWRYYGCGGPVEVDRGTYRVRGSRLQLTGRYQPQELNQELVLQTNRDQYQVWLSQYQIALRQLPNKPQWAEQTRGCWKGRLKVDQDGLSVGGQRVEANVEDLAYLLDEEPTWSSLDKGLYQVAYPSGLQAKVDWIPVYYPEPTRTWCYPKSWQHPRP